MDLTLERRNILTQRGKLYKPQEKIDHFDRQKRCFHVTILGNELAFIKFSAFVVLLFFMNCASYEVNAFNAQCKKFDNNTQGL